MEEAKYESRYLLSILAAVLSNKKAPLSVRHLNWERLFKLADYHNVANLAYYGLLGLGEEIPPQWQNKFFEKYQDAVIQEELLKKAEEVLAWQIDRYKVRCVFLKDTVIRSCYPYPEMHMVDYLEILTEPGSGIKIDMLMTAMDYVKQKQNSVPGSMYRKTPGVSVVSYDYLSFTSKKMRQYFESMLLRLHIKKGYKHICDFTKEEFYIYLVSTMTRDYACADLDIRAMIDLWVFYIKYRDELQWNYIEKELEKMKIEEFVDRLLILDGIWFGGINLEDVEISDEMEAYILTKGKEGRVVSAQLLPLVKNVADFYAKNSRKEWMKAQIKWMFPKMEYMQTLYPVLNKYTVFLVPCWILRLLRSLISFLKRKIKQFLKHLKKTMKEKWLSFKTQAAERWNNIWNKIKKGKE